MHTLYKQRRGMPIRPAPTFGRMARAAHKIFLRPETDRDGLPNGRPVRLLLFPSALDTR